MNFPVGPVKSKGNLPTTFETISDTLMKNEFNGYVIQSVRAHFIEEGVLFWRDGNIYACIVECLGLAKIIKGKDALGFFLNQTKGNGFYQVIELSRSQVDLVTAFDEMLLTGKIDLKELPKLIPITFESRFEAVAQQKDVLSTYGLSDLATR